MGHKNIYTGPSVGLYSPKNFKKFLDNISEFELDEERTSYPNSMGNSGNTTIVGLYAREVAVMYCEYILRPVEDLTLVLDKQIIISLIGDENVINDLERKVKAAETEETKQAILMAKN